MWSVVFAKHRLISKFVDSSGTVILNANVALLAIPDVIPDSTSRSPAQIASYVSLATSTGSVLASLLLARQNRTRSRELPEAVSFFLLDFINEDSNFFSSNHHQILYLQRMTHPVFHLELLATIYALPYALLMWR